MIHRYNRLFFMTDTCQANTLYSQIYSPNVLATGSSALGENSYSVSASSLLSRHQANTVPYIQHHNDPDIGVAVIDSYTHHVLQYLEEIKIGSNATMQEFVSFSCLTTYSRTANEMCASSLTITIQSKSSRTLASLPITSHSTFPPCLLPTSSAACHKQKG